MSRRRESTSPESDWRLPYSRAWNIGLRTAHIAVSGVLVGGHVFDVPRDRLLPWLYATLMTGGLLALLEAFPHVRWCYQGRGLLIGVKLILLSLIPWFWDARVPILGVVVVIACVGSHMPARFRYYSVIHRRVLD
ncbi:MAG: hypothetical protein ACYC3X_05330 [Pirellulaceae bacterium]